MRGTMLYGPRDVRFEERPDPTMIAPTDAIIRISAACVCGSDLWPYRGIAPITEPTPMGHEYCGIVDVYVRAYRGHETAWFQQIQRRPSGHIEAGGVTKDVTLVDASSDGALNHEIDAAYQSKYHRYSETYVDPMIAPQARATTLKLVPSA